MRQLRIANFGLRIKSPHKTFLGHTWVGWINQLFLQWFLVRLGYPIPDTNDTWCLVGFVLPLSGWWSDYIKIEDVLRALRVFAVKAFAVIRDSVHLRHPRRP